MNLVHYVLFVNYKPIGLQQDFFVDVALKEKRVLHSPRLQQGCYSRGSSITSCGWKPYYTDYKREVDALALVVFYGSHYFFIPGLTFASILMFFSFF